MSLVEAEFKNNIFNKLSPRILEALKSLEIDQECEVYEQKGVRIILSKDRIAGITTIYYGELFIKTFTSSEYREATEAILQPVNKSLIKVPSGVLYTSDIMRIIKTLKPVIIKYPLQPDPMLIKKPSLNISILIAQYND
jgi:hypothetical protein